MTLDDMYPPDDMNFVGAGDFRFVGNHLCELVKGNCGLNADDRILDVGCGIGRMAIPLTQYLSTEGRYEGIDIVESGIKWCQERVTPRYPNFRFTLADVYNKMYNASGRKKAEKYKFPYKDKSFDLVILTSVFTHMLGTPMENYLSQIARVLDIGGRCFITYYVRTEESAARIARGQSAYNFVTYRDGCWLHDPKNPEHAVCYDLDRIEDLYKRYGLEIQKRDFSGWSDGSAAGAQDYIVARKTHDTKTYPGNGTMLQKVAGIFR